MSSPPTIGIGTSSSSRGRRKTPARKYLRPDRDASELRRSRYLSRHQPDSRQLSGPQAADACHLWLRVRRLSEVRLEEAQAGRRFCVVDMSPTKAPCEEQSQRAASTSGSAQVRWATPLQ